MTGPLRVGVVGIGFGQAVHVPAFRRDPRCVVVALAASDRERAARVAHRLGIPSAYGDWRELVASDAVDVVSMAVPPALQPDIAMAAAAVGKPVFCEKPLAVNGAAAERMFAAVTGARVAHAVDLEFAEIPAWQAAKRLLEEGAIGRPRSVSFSWRVRTRTRDPGGWKAHAEAGGGALGGFAAHALYLIEWTLGPVRRLAGWVDTEGGRARADVWLELASGCRATLSIATDAAAPTGCRVRYEGEGGALIVENGGPDHVRGYHLMLARGAGSLEPHASTELPDDGEDARVAVTAPIVSRFIDAVNGGSSVRPDLSDGLRVQRLLDAVVAASSTRGWIAT